MDWDSATNGPYNGITKHGLTKLLYEDYSIVKHVFAPLIFLIVYDGVITSKGMNGDYAI